MPEYRMDYPYNYIVVTGSWDKLKDHIIPALLKAGVVEPISDDYIYEHRPLMSYGKPEVLLYFKNPDLPEVVESGEVQPAAAGEDLNSDESLNALSL